MYVGEHYSNDRQSHQEQKLDNSDHSGFTVTIEYHFFAKYRQYNTNPGLRSDRRARKEDPPQLDWRKINKATTEAKKQQQYMKQVHHRMQSQMLKRTQIR